MPTRVAAVILAAGAGARLGGVNKAALPLRGATFLGTVVATARAAGIEEVVVVAGPPHGDETRELAAGARVAWNAHPERGMLSSFVVGLQELDADAALLWPVDHAFAGAATVTAVAAAATRDAIVIPTYRGRGGHPTAFGAAHFAALRAAATARDVIGAAGAERVRRLPTDDAGVVRDVDEPADRP